MVDTLYWIWLSLVCGTRYNIAEKLLVCFEMNPEFIYKADEREIMQITENRLKNTFSHELDEAKTIQEYCYQSKIGLLTPDSEYYPERLRKIKDKPVLLYYRGKLPDFNNRLCITTVGTRRMTDYGKQSAYTIIYDLTKCGTVIISGMALGVDGMCHRAAIDAGGQTVAVLGCGINRVYPREHDSLMDEIIEYGAVITEFKPSTPPSGFNFPLRNRIMSGLSQGTFVIEADKKSGAMITARSAIYQGRDIFALPGKIGEMNSGGTNSLIQQGAIMVTTAHDILNIYAGLYPSSIKVEKSSYRFPEQSMNDPAVSVKVGKKQKKQLIITQAAQIHNSKDSRTVDTTKISIGQSVNPPALSEDEQQIYDLMSDGQPATADALARKGFSVSSVLTILTMLEIKGIIKVLPGGLYKIT
ncbi:MAG: DNA-processing protein DprA [Eubacteriales bacterium]|nr:DNA-processing protein DprA [Eubacteriales bacterium]